MITVRGRTLIIPANEQIIGTDLDDRSEVRRFRLNRIPGGIEISHLKFYLDLLYQDEIYDTCRLEKEVLEDHITLTWNIQKSNLVHPGTVWIALRARNETEEVVWGTARAACYVYDTINTPEQVGMSELTRYQELLDNALESFDEKISEIDTVKGNVEQLVGNADKIVQRVEKAEEETVKCAEAVRKQLENAEDSAGLAEAWAHGKDGYTEQENDNSRYWSESAKQSAEYAREQAVLAGQYADKNGELPFPLRDRGAYEAETEYRKNDLVWIGKRAWRCKSETAAGIEPEEGNTWALFYEYTEEDEPSSSDEMAERLTQLQGKIEQMHTVRKITLTASSWSVSYPYTQTVEADGITTESNLKVIGLHIPEGATAEQIKEWNRAASLLVSHEEATGEGTVTFYAYEKPETDFTVMVEGG